MAYPNFEPTAGAPTPGSMVRGCRLVAAAVLAIFLASAGPAQSQERADDGGGIVLSATALAINEGGTASYTVALRTRPTGNVRITLWRTSYGVHFRPYRRYLQFTPENWNTPRTVTLSAPQDDDARDDTVTVTHTASGGGYDGVPNAALEVTVDDDDSPGIAVSPATLVINEGGTAAYTVALRTRPEGNVRVTLWRTSYGVYFRPYRRHLQFTPENWNTPRTVTLSAPQDNDARDDTVTVTHTASGGGYDGVPNAALEVRVADNDKAVLSSLTLEGVALNEAFARGRTSYSATVGHTVDTVTIGAAARDDDATLAMPEDTDTEQPGVQVALEVGANVIAVRVTAGDGSTTIYTVTVTRLPPSITASLKNVPDMHDGRPFTIDLELNAYVWISAANMRDRAFTVTGGRITRVRRISRRHLSIDGKRRPFSNRWRLTVRPDGLGPVTLSLAASRPCDEPGAICAPFGHPVGNSLDLTVQGLGEVTLSLDPPSGPTPESGGLMQFTVRMSRPLPQGVIFCWRTVEATPPASTDSCPWSASAARPGSASAGADYRSSSGFFRTDPGQASQVLGVQLFDDSVDDDGETVTVEIAHARILNPDGSPGAAIPIEAATAVGVIANSGAIPRAWLVRFGRTVAEQVVDTVRDRVSAPRRPGFAARLAGHAVDGQSCSGKKRDTATSEPTKAAVMAVPEGLPTAARRCKEGRPLPDGDPALGVTWPGGGRPARHLRQPTPEEMIAGTSLALSRRTATGRLPSQDGLVSLWVRGAASRFDGGDSGVAVDGAVTSGLFGADYAEEHWGAGLIFSVSRGTGSYRGASSGKTEASLTGLFPWGRYALSDRASLWGVAGYGVGALTVKPESGPGARTDIDLALAALGAESTLLAPGPEGGPALTAVADLLGLRTTSEAVEGMAASRAYATRLRVGLRASWTFPYDAGKAGNNGGAGKGRGSLTPSLEIGLRHDGGDAESGLGLEMGGGFAWSDTALGLTVQVRAQALLSHADGAFRAQGVSGALTWDPRPSSAFGPSLSLRRSLGASSSGGMADLIGRASNPGRLRGGGEPTLHRASRLCWATACRLSAAGWRARRNSASACRPATGHTGSAGGCRRQPGTPVRRHRRNPDPSISRWTRRGTSAPAAARSTISASGSRRASRAAETTNWNESRPDEYLLRVHARSGPPGIPKLPSRPTAPSSAATPGSVRPSSHSRKAPPAVET